MCIRDSTWEDHDGQIGSGRVSTDIGITAITKAADGAYHLSAHTQSWSVTIDTKKLDFGGNLRVLDLLVYGDHFDASDIDGSNLPSGITAETLKTIKPSYHQKYTMASFASDSLGCQVVTLSQGGKAVADLLVVTNSDDIAIDHTKTHTYTYSTTVTDPAVYAGNGRKTITNTASLFSASTKLTDAAASSSFNSSMVEKTMLTREAAGNLTQITNVNSIAGSDTAAFDFVHRSVIFRILINKNSLKDATEDLTTVSGEKLGSLTLADTLPAGWEFQNIDSDKKFLIYEADADGNAVGSPLTSTDDFLTMETDYNSLTFAKLTKPYVILLKAGPTETTAEEYFAENDTTTVTNRASLNNDRFSVSDSQKVSISSKLLDKTLDKAKADSHGYLTWTVKYQPYNLAHIAPYMEDVLPAGIDLRTDSRGGLDFSSGNITAKEMTLQQDGSYTEGASVADLSSRFTYEPNTRTLCFVIPDPAKAYKITYVTDVTGSSGSVSNKVSLPDNTSGGNPLSVRQAYSISAQSAAASLKRGGWLQIDKTDQENNPLSDAEFTLFAADHTTSLRTGVTDHEGKLILRAIPTGTYYLRETKAPDNYVLSGKNYEVQVTADTSGKITTAIAGQRGPDSNKVTVVNSKNGSGNEGDHEDHGNTPIFPQEVTGDLRISNALTGTSVENDKQLTYKVTLTDGKLPLAGTYPCLIGSAGTLVKLDSQGTAQISCRASEQILIKNLPSGAWYKVTPVVDTDEGYRLTGQNNAAGMITASRIQEAAFSYTRQIGSLTVTNTVQGKGSDRSKVFDFQIVFTGNQKKTYSYIDSTGGSGLLKSGETIGLCHGQQITILDIPAGIEYSVTEASYKAEGYQTTALGQRGTISADVQSLAAFSNVLKAEASIVPSDPGNIPSGDSSHIKDKDIGKAHADSKTVQTGDSSAMKLYLLLLISTITTLTWIIHRYKRS